MKKLRIILCGLLAASGMAFACALILMVHTGTEDEVTDNAEEALTATETITKLLPLEGEAPGDRVVYDASAKYKFEERVSAFLAAGEFSELDSWLASLQSGYMDDASGEEQYAESMDERILNLRSDLALIELLNDPASGSELLREFKSADALAAAVVFSSASLKLDAFIDQDSEILPGVPYDDRYLTALREVDLDDGTRLDLLRQLNARRTAEGGYSDVRVFAFHAFFRECRVMIVRQKSLAYSPYSLEIVDGAAIFTVRELKDLREAALQAKRAFDADSLMSMRSEAASTGADAEQPGRRVEIRIPDDFVIPLDDFPIPVS